VCGENCQSRTSKIVMRIPRGAAEVSVVPSVSGNVEEMVVLDADLVARSKASRLLMLGLTKAGSCTDLNSRRDQYWSLSCPSTDFVVGAAAVNPNWQHLTLAERLPCMHGWYGPRRGSRRSRTVLESHQNEPRPLTGLSSMQAQVQHGFAPWFAVPTRILLGDTVLVGPTPTIHVSLCYVIPRRIMTLWKGQTLEIHFHATAVRYAHLHTGKRTWECAFKLVANRLRTSIRASSPRRQRV
jgi:hypothetical protein